MPNQNAERMHHLLDDGTLRRAKSTSFYMLKRIIVWLAVAYLAILAIAAFLGFGNVPGYSWEGGKVLCYVLLTVPVALAVIAFIGRMLPTVDGRRDQARDSSQR